MTAEAILRNRLIPRCGERNSVILVRLKTRWVGVALVSRGVVSLPIPVRDSSLESWLQRIQATVRLPRRPLPYAFAASLAIHVAVAAAFLAFQRHPVAFGVAPLQGGVTSFYISSGQPSSDPAPQASAAVKKGPLEVIASQPVAPAAPQAPATLAPPQPASLPPAVPTAAPSIQAKLSTNQGQLHSAVPGAPSDGQPTGQGSTVARATVGAGLNNDRGTTVASDGSNRGGTGTVLVEAKPDYLRNPPPKYPSVARKQGWQGLTILRVEVLSDGSPDRIEVLKTSGHRILDDASVRSVREWKFMPARLGDRPVSAWVEVPIRFQLVGS